MKTRQRRHKRHIKTKKRRGGSTNFLVEYPTAAKCKTKEEVAVEPKIRGKISTTPLTLIMRDPDAPDSKPNSYLHWLVPGITNLNKLPPAAIQYTGPNPPPGSGKHRYIFEIYEGVPTSIPTGRSNFNPNQIGLIGKPIYTYCFEVMAAGL